MKKESYIGKWELIDVLKVGHLSGELEEIAKRTNEPDWRRKIRCAATYLSNVLDERLQALDPKQLRTVKRRHHHTIVQLVTSDQARLQVNDGRPEEEITVETEALYDIIDLAMLSCFKCSQGEVVKDCRFRNHFHTWGVPPCRTNPKDGECEFSNNKIGEIKLVNPLYEEIKGTVDRI